MRTITTENSKVITNEEIDVITQLVETGLLQGADYDHDKSLFEFGFLYDSNTQTVIYTKKMHMWPEMKERLTFRVGKVSMDYIHEQFEKNKKDILEMSDVDESTWMSMCDAYKINDIEEFNLGLSKKLPTDSLTIEELIAFMQGYVKENYSYLL